MGGGCIFSGAVMSILNVCNYILTFSRYFFNYIGKMKNSVHIFCLRNLFGTLLSLQPQIASTGGTGQTREQKV